MLRICAEVPVNATPEAVWEVLSHEQTFVQAQAKLDEANTPRDPNRKPEPVKMRLTRWEAPKGATLELSAPALRFFATIVTEIQDEGEGKSRIAVRIGMTMGLMVILRILYTLVGRRRIEHSLQDLLAGLAYSAEHGLSNPTKPVDPALYAYLRPSVKVFNCK